MTVSAQATRHLLSNANFSALTPAEAEGFVAKGSVREFKAGDVLLRSGGPGDSMLFLTEGRVIVSLDGIELSREGPGAIFGEMSLVDPGPRSATVTARQDGQLIEFRRELVVALLTAADPAGLKVLQGITATVSSRLNSVNSSVRKEVARPRANVFRRLWDGFSKGRKRTP